MGLYRANRPRNEPTSCGRKLHLETLEARCVLSANVVSAYAEALPQWFAAAPAIELAGGATIEESNSASAPTERWIVRLMPEATVAAGSVAESARIVSELSATAIRGLGLPGLLLVEASAEIAATLAADPRIAYVEADQRIAPRHYLTRRDSRNSPVSVTPDKMAR